MSTILDRYFTKLDVAISLVLLKATKIMEKEQRGVF